MKNRLLKYGKVFATKVVMKNYIPVDDEKTCLNTLEKVPDPVRSRRISLYLTIPGSGQKNDDINSRCPIHMVKTDY